MRQMAAVIIRKSILYCKVVFGNKAALIVAWHPM